MAIKRPKGRPEQIKTFFDTMFEGSTLGERFRTLRIWSDWSAMVGHAIALRAKPLRFNAGQLTVAVESAPWMQQLTYMKSELRHRINECLGEILVKEIILRSGKISEIPDDENKLPECRAISMDKMRVIEHSAAGMPEVELAQMFRLLMEKHYSLGKG